MVHGDVLLHDVERSFFHTTGPLLAAVGLSDHTVVATPDAVLIAPRQRSQDVKQLVDLLKKQRRPEALRHKKDYRPWGWYEEIVRAERFQVKRLTLRPDAKVSLQKHHHRAEHWIVVRGTARVTKGDETFLLGEDQSTYIPLGVAHRLENTGKIELDLIEVRTGSYLSEDDIIRFDDAYGR